MYAAFRRLAAAPARDDNRELAASGSFDADDELLCMAYNHKVIRACCF